MSWWSWVASWWRRYWPWLVVLIWLVGYELYAILSHTRTLSQMVWDAGGRNPWLWIVVVVIVAILLWHFFVSGKTWRERVQHRSRWPDDGPPQDWES